MKQRFCPPPPGQMPLPVYEKVFAAAEEGFISETYENLCCLRSLSENFTPKCVRTIDRGFDANDYYRYFLKRSECFVISAKKNRNVIFNGKTCNIMDVATRYKGNYRLDFKTEPLPAKAGRFDELLKQPKVRTLQVISISLFYPISKLSELLLSCKS